MTYSMVYINKTKYNESFKVLQLKKSRADWIYGITIVAIRIYAITIGNIGSIPYNFIDVRDMPLLTPSIHL